MKHALSTLDDPIIASVSPTFTMALIYLCFLDRIFTNAAWINVDWRSDFTFYFNDLFVAVHIFPTKSNWNIFIQAGLLRLSALALFLILLNCLSMSWENCFG